MSPATESGLIKPAQLAVDSKTWDNVELAPQFFFLSFDIPSPENLAVVGAFCEKQEGGVRLKKVVIVRRGR